MGCGASRDHPAFTKPCNAGTSIFAPYSPSNDDKRLPQSGCLDRHLVGEGAESHPLADDDCPPHNVNGPITVEEDVCTDSNPLGSPTLRDTSQLHYSRSKDAFASIGDEPLFQQPDAMLHFDSLVQGAMDCSLNSRGSRTSQSALTHRCPCSCTGECSTNEYVGDPTASAVVHCDASTDFERSLCSCSDYPPSFPYVCALAP